MTPDPRPGQQTGNAKQLLKRRGILLTSYKQQPMLLRTDLKRRVVIDCPGHWSLAHLGGGTQCPWQELRAAARTSSFNDCFDPACQKSH